MDDAEPLRRGSCVISFGHGHLRRVRDSGKHQLSVSSQWLLALVDESPDQHPAYGSQSCPYVSRNRRSVSFLMSS